MNASVERPAYSRIVATLAIAVCLIPTAFCDEPSWYRAPTLAVMTGFIKEPLKPFTIQEWEKGLGSQMDADRWVADFKEAGATYLIFYDKWIDGFVFHDTKTTGFKTHRDFLREVADACHRGNLRLVPYFNAISDGNPEFKEWAVHDRQGKPIVFSPRWPTGYQTLHSPFRRISVEQVREVLTGYGRIDGLWLDIFRERLNTSSPWVAKAYEKQYGGPLEKATPGTLDEFNARTLAGYLDEVRPIARKHQPGFVWTSNGSARATVNSGVWERWVGPRLDYGSVEGHRFERIDQFARLTQVNPRPTEIGLLLNSSWFCPMEDTPPPACMTERQAIAAAAIALCQGASVYMALTPGHSGRFGEDLERAKAVGAWFQGVEPLVRDAEPYADVGVVLGAPAIDGPGLPVRNTLWKRYAAKQMHAIDEALAISDALGRAGVFSRLLYSHPHGRSWPESLAGLRAILVPERALLDDAHLDRLREYVDGGGRLVAFGHATMLDENASRRKDFVLGDVFGARCKGEAVFEPKALKTLVKTDSEYSPDFSAENLVDGTSAAWASGGTPMPHWAEISLAEPVDVAKVELVSRQGPYLVTDLDIEAHDGTTWKPVQSVRGATTRVVSVPLDPPVRTSRIRVTILRELFENEDRQYADVEAIRIVDPTGRDRAANRGEPVRLVEVAADVKCAFERNGDGRPLSFPPMAVEVEPTKAEVIGRLDNRSHSPAVLRNRYGRGEAILVTTGEGSFQGQDSFWAGMSRLAVGEPTFSCEAADRYRILLARVGGKHVLHVIDRTAGTPDYEPADATVTLEGERLGGARSATSADERTPVKTQLNGGRLTVVLRPDPVASVVLE